MFSFLKKFTLVLFITVLGFSFFGCEEAEEKASKAAKALIEEAAGVAEIVIAKVQEVFKSELTRSSVKVILPPDYNKDTTYPVVYLQDGQDIGEVNEVGGPGVNLDTSLTELVNNGEIEPVIIVCIPSVGAKYVIPRIIEYSHTASSVDEELISGYVGKDSWEQRKTEIESILITGKTLTSVLSSPIGGGADEYLDYVINTVMPSIEKEYSVKTGPENTAIFGYSFGGLLSFYGAWKHSDKFGKVAALSSYFIWDNSDIINDVVENTTAVPDLEIYLYSGTKGDIGSQFKNDGQAETLAMKEKLVEKGFVLDQDLYYETIDESLFSDDDISADWGHHNYPIWDYYYKEALKKLFPKK